MKTLNKKIMVGALISALALPAFAANSETEMTATQDKQSEWLDDDNEITSTPATGGLVSIDDVVHWRVVGPLDARREEKNLYEVVEVSENLKSGEVRKQSIKKFTLHSSASAYADMMYTKRKLSDSARKDRVRSRFNAKELVK